MSTGARYWSHSWNPFAGCSPCSPECDHCWACRMAASRLARVPAYKGLAYIDDSGERAPGPYWTGEVRRMPAFDKPPRLRSGVLFAGDMTDLFHEEQNERDVRSVLASLEHLSDEVAPLVLTKRAKIMRTVMTWHAIHGPRGNSRIWCGVTIGCESSRWRLAELQRTPCAGRWLSLEPLLEPLPGLDLTGIGWVVVGCESGPGSRECFPVWIGDIVRQCAIANVPCFVKQVRLGKSVSRDMSEWPEALRVRQRPAQWVQR